jgi:hypothetical protein
MNPFLRKQGEAQMDRKRRVHKLISQLADEILEYIKEQEPFYENRWVPSLKLKKDLELDFVCVPKQNKQYGKKGWLFAILARKLEDEGKLEYYKIGDRAYYRSIRDK